MQPADERRRHAISRLLFALAIAAAAAAVLLGATGGFTIRPFGVRVSAHGALRPALLALLAAAVALRWLPAERQVQLLARWRHLTDRLLPVSAVFAATTVLVLGLTFGARVAGGSDGYGYVSEARLWLGGNLHVPSALVTDAPWPNAEWTFAPLGYRPADGHTVVPTYAPGVPLLMALFRTTLGSCGPYLVNPVCAAVLVLLAYGLGVRVSGPVTGAIAALSVASSPTLLFMSMFAMSDVPAAAFWTGAVLLACRSTRSSAAGSGLAAGIAITMRPNLAPLALGPALIAVWPMIRQDSRDAWRRLFVFGGACLPFVLFIALLNNRLYGSPFQSGYGDTAALFSAGHVPANFVRFPRWLWQTQGPLIFIFPAAMGIRSPGPSRLVLRRMLVAFVVLVFICYLWYTPFDAWWYLRFVLPAFPVMFVLAADVVWWGTRRFGSRARIVAAVVFAWVTIDYGITQARDRGAFEIGTGEQKYADVGRYVAGALPRNAVVFTVQHSGSIRYYSGRAIVQWEWMEGAWLDRAIEYLRASGFEPFVILEQSEMPVFRERFASQHSVGLIDRAPLAVHSRGVYIYGTSATAAAPPVTVPHTTGCE